ncbi:hypothetical protein FVEG_05702 [Fusarium verticillioides 7600]|uniref:Uncharacterized protein n=1 Tax=Gibberella moniliformis (strain M3125 / FGSC 7600) TaxID=334819 RepID=W7M190_GIBM7|nr:hypothetical protein FVEG_05702 [Fusarium verticillioides 7600]EWG44706.1 hypothetical protein FVEG_05702 [Fusarium verticillioides 7600]
MDDQVLNLDHNTQTDRHGVRPGPIHRHSRVHGNSSKFFRIRLWLWWYAQRHYYRCRRWSRSRLDIDHLAFFLWRRRRKSANQKQQPSQFYAANSEAPATARKPSPPFVSSPPTPAGERDTWASSPSRSDYSQPPSYLSPMPELGNTQFAYEMHTSPQRPPQELYHPQYTSGLGLPEMRDQRRG